MFQLQEIITQIQTHPVDVLYVFGTTATKAVLLRIKDVPVVFNIVSRPVDSGIIASWESSKNNATGASNKVSTVNGYNISSISSVGSMVPEDGVLMGFVPKYYKLGQIAAGKAILILNGKKPSDIPSSVLDYAHISVNMRTAKKINIQIPMSVLVMANQIIR